MDPQTESVLRRIEQEAFDQRQNREATPLEQRYLLVGPETGRFLNLLVRSSGATRILEVGTSVGYSAIWLALGARETGGRVTTLEQSEWKCQKARQHWAEAGVADRIELIPGDALETLQRLEGPWDFVFLDAWKNDYVRYLDLVFDHIRPGGLIVADNILSHRDDPHIQAYVEKCRSHPGLDTVTVPIGSGEEMSIKRR